MIFVLFRYIAKLRTSIKSDSNWLDSGIALATKGAPSLGLFFNMEFVVYILYSYPNERFYIGFSSNLIQRIYWHNNGNKGFTIRYRPWSVINVEFFEAKQQAIQREKYLKTGKGREWIKNYFNKSTGFISA